MLFICIYFNGHGELSRERKLNYSPNRITVFNEVNTDSKNAKLVNPNISTSSWEKDRYLLCFTLPLPPRRRNVRKRP